MYWRSHTLCTLLFISYLLSASSAKVEFDASGQISAFVRAQEVVDQSRVTTVAVNAFDCVAMCSISPKKSQKQARPMSFVCQCDDLLAGYAGFAGDVQASQQALQKVKDAATKQMGISASVSQCAVALADGTMRSSTGDSRPLIVNTLLAGIENVQAARRPVLYHLGVAGDYRAVKAAAIGAGADIIHTRLRRHAKLFGAHSKTHVVAVRRASLAVYLALRCLLDSEGEAAFDSEHQHLEVAVLNAAMKSNGPDWDAHLRPFTAPVIAIPQHASIVRSAFERSDEVMAWYRTANARVTERDLSSKDLFGEVQLDDFAEAVCGDLSS